MLAKSRVNGTRMTRMTRIWRIIADKTKENLRIYNISFLMILLNFVNTSLSAESATDNSQG
jgi:hypothetical protein